MIGSELEPIKELISKHGYEYCKFLGKGSYSVVLLCESKKYSKQFALKRAIKHKLLVEEYKTLVSLNHPNIISIYDQFEDDNYTYLIIDYCSNGSIRQKTKLTYDKFIVYAKQMLEGIAYCHARKIAHRDIKPDNIFLDKNDYIKIGDFGFAKQFQENEKSKEKLGSMTFIPPEMLQYNEICPFKADIWALGVTFFYIVTGDYPFKGSTPEKFKESIIHGDINFSKYNVDPKIRFLINKMTTKNPLMRPTAEQLLRLPIFVPELAKKTLLLAGCGIKNSHTLKFNNRSFLSHNHVRYINDGPSDEAKKNNSMIGSHCYKSIITCPNIPRMNSHYFVGKPE